MYISPPCVVLKLNAILRMAQPMPKHVLLNKMQFSRVLCVDFLSMTAASPTSLHSTAMWIGSDELTIRSQVQSTVGAELLRCANILYRFLQAPIAKDTSLCQNNQRTSRPCMCSCSVALGTSGYHRRRSEHCNAQFSASFSDQFVSQSTANTQRLSIRRPRLIF